MILHVLLFACQALGFSTKADLADPESLSTLSTKIIRPDYTLTPGVVIDKSQETSKSRQLGQELLKKALNLFEKHDFQHALDTFVQSIEADPTCLEAWNYVGQIFLSSGKVDLAIDYFKKAAEIEGRPNAVLETNIANCYVQKRTAAKKPADQHKYLLSACHHFIQAADSTAKEAKLKLQAGRCFTEMGKPREALLELKKAQRIGGDTAETFVLMGHVYKLLELPNEALKAYEKTLNIEPNNLEALKGLSALYQYTFLKIDLAAQYLARAIELDPTDPVSVHNLGSAFNMAGHYKEAIEKYQEALRLSPNSMQSWIELLNLKKTICDWSTYWDDLVRLEAMLKDELPRGAKSLLSAWYSMNFPLDPITHKKIAANYAAVDFLPFKQRLTTKFKHPKKLEPGHKLKVGIVTADAGGTNVGHDIVGWFVHHNEEESGIELHLFVTKTPDNSIFYRFTTEQCRHVHEIHQMTHENAATYIHSLGIHILINLNGYTKWSRTEIFAQQPAPLQINFKGYPGTLGDADWHQYMLGDKYTTPFEHEEHFSEKLIHLPHCYFMASYPIVFGHIVDPEQEALFSASKKSELGLPEDKFIFANFNHLPKVDPTIFDIWMKILKRVPSSVLWLLRLPADAEANLFKEAAKRGVSKDRLIFTSLAPIQDHLSIKGLADLFLDTPVFNGHGTGMDILWAGVPVLTISGKTFQSRTGRAYSTVLGVTDLIVDTLEEYEEKAVDLATDHIEGGSILKDIRERVRANRHTSPLFDTKRWVRDWQEAMKMIWDIYEQGEKPRHVVVPDKGPVGSIEEWRNKDAKKKFFLNK